MIYECILTLVVNPSKPSFCLTKRSNPLLPHRQNTYPQLSVSNLVVYPRYISPPMHNLKYVNLKKSVLLSMLSTSVILYDDTILLK